jgi:uncharacterized membrane protein (UPF0136 family)
MTEPRRDVPVALTAAAGVVSLLAIASSFIAARLIGTSALVLLVAAPFDSTGHSAGMLLAGICAVVVPALVGFACVGLTATRRPVPAIVLGVLAIALGCGVGSWIAAYFRPAPAPIVTDRSAIARPCTQSDQCPAGYQCVGTIGTGTHCEIPCASSNPCPAGLTCTAIGMLSVCR